MARFYVMSVQPTRFGGGSLVRNWGRSFCVRAAGKMYPRRLQGGSDLFLLIIIRPIKLDRSGIAADRLQDTIACVNREFHWLGSIFSELTCSASKKRDC